MNVSEIIVRRGVKRPDPQRFPPGTIFLEKSVHEGTGEEQYEAWLRVTNNKLPFVNLRTGDCIYWSDKATIGKLELPTPGTQIRINISEQRVFVRLRNEEKKHRERLNGNPVQV